MFGVIILHSLGLISKDFHGKNSYDNAANTKGFKMLL